MTETALLCFFIYVPVLMMVIVWGDMSLDKERAHVAAGYMAFREDGIDPDELQDRFFPFAGGQPDPTGSVRTVEMNPGEDDLAIPGPEFELPGAGGDYSPEDAPEFDLQYKLFNLAMGHVRVTRSLEAVDGGVEFMEDVHREQTDVSRYLSENGIVPFDQDAIPTDLPGGPVGAPRDLETGVDSREYTEYVRSLTDVFNGDWEVTGNRMPRRESAAFLETTFRSPFLWELEREETGAGRNRAQEAYVGGRQLPRVGGEPGFRMRFGPGEERELGDDSFRTGYTYLRNSEVRPSADNLWEDVGELSEDLFNHPETDARLVDMGRTPSMSAERDAMGESHMLYLTPGDPRPVEEE
jgi:hypothetical protein